MLYKETVNICYGVQGDLDIYYVLQEHCRYLLWCLIVLEVSGAPRGIATPSFSLKGSSLGIGINYEPNCFTCSSLH